MHQKDQELPHLGNRIKLQPTLDFARVLGIRHGQVRVPERMVASPQVIHLGCRVAIQKPTHYPQILVELRAKHPVTCQP